MPKNKVMVYVELDPGSHRLLVEMASRRGVQRLVDFTSTLVEEKLQELCEVEAYDSVLAPWIELANYHRQLAHSQQVRGQLLDLAQAYLAQRDDTNYDRLAALCTSNGYDVEEIMADAGALKGIVPGNIVNFGGQDQAAVAIRFLETMFQGTNGTLLANTVIEAAKTANISLNALNIAKRRRGINSVKDGTRWTWVMPTLIEVSAVKISRI